MSAQRMPAEQRKRSLLKAAERCVARKGYYSATTADIAAEAGVTEPVLYQHFRDKEDLIECMRAATQKEINIYVTRRALKQPSPLRGLRELAAAVLDYTIRHRNKMRSQIYAIPNLGSGGLREILNENIKTAHRAILSFLREARRQGEIDESVDISAFAWSFQSMIRLVYVANAMDIDAILKNKQKYMDIIDRLLATVSISSNGED